MAKVQSTNAIYVLQMANCQGIFLVCAFGLSLALLIYLSQWLIGRNGRSKPTADSTAHGGKRIQAAPPRKVKMTNTTRKLRSSIRSYRPYRQRPLNHNLADQVSSSVSSPELLFIVRTPWPCADQGKRTAIRNPKHCATVNVRSQHKSWRRRLTGKVGHVSKKTQRFGGKEKASLRSCTDKAASLPMRHGALGGPTCVIEPPFHGIRFPHSLHQV